MLVLVAASVLSGCASFVSPHDADDTSPIAVPARWASADGAAHATTAAPTALAQWWTRFDDPVLVSLVEQSLATNTQVQVARAALRQARAQRDVAAAALSPSLAGSASAQRDPGGGSDGNTFAAGLDARWELDLFGAKRRGVDAGDAAAAASLASLGDVQVSIAAEVALNTITLRSAQQRLAIAQANLETQAETLQITQWRVQAGLATSLESEQARSAVEQTRAQLPVLQTQIDQARHALAVLTGQAPSALSEQLGAVAPVPQAPADIALAFPADTLRQRPDVRAAEWQVLAAAARVAQADAQRLPNVQIGGSLGLGALTLAGLANGAALTSAVFSSLSVPLLDGGATRAQVGVQQAAYEQARASYRQAVLTALQEVEDALVALRQDRARLGNLQSAADAAGNAALLARQRYSSGLVDFQTVLETQRTQLSAQDNVASAVAAVSADHVRLYKALGGGWQPTTTGAGSAASATLQRPASP